jgi:hypothetical protein
MRRIIASIISFQPINIEKKWRDLSNLSNFPRVTVLKLCRLIMTDGLLHDAVSRGELRVQYCERFI